MCQQSSALVICAAVALAGCGGGSSHAPADAGSSSTSDLAVQQHRPVAAACPALGTSGCAPGSTGTIACMIDSDCTDSKFGRCYQCACIYSDCLSDTDCSGDNTCICHADVNTSVNTGNACSSVGNCRVDSDCGPKGACSPVFYNCVGRPHYTTGYYCHTAADTCRNDSDCTQDGGFSYDYCDYSPEVGHWACAEVSCAG